MDNLKKVEEIIHSPTTDSVDDGKPPKGGEQEIIVTTLLWSG